MESSTMIRDGDGGSPDAGVPTSESQAGYPTQASLAAEPSPATAKPTKGAKKAIFGGNKATMLFRISNLTQTWRENKANLKSALSVSACRFCLGRGRAGKTKPTLARPCL